MFWKKSRHVEKVHTLVVLPYTIDEALELPPREYVFLRIDVSINCNLHCVYCEIGRGKELLSLDKTSQFFQQQVKSVDHIVYGCAMEPTINRDLGQFLLAARQLANPSGDLAIQTNGILLDRHDPAIMREAGLNLISLSIDSIRPETIQVLRDGTDINRVLANIDRLRNAIPGLQIMYSTVVTSRNLSEIEELVEFAQENGVRDVWLREVTYQQENVPPERAELVLAPGQFDELERSIRARGLKIPVNFLYSDNIVHDDELNRDSWKV